MQIFIMYYIRPIHQPISTHLSIWPAISIDVYTAYIHNRFRNTERRDSAHNGDLNAPIVMCVCFKKKILCILKQWPQRRLKEVLIDVYQRN